MVYKKIPLDKHAQLLRKIPQQNEYREKSRDYDSKTFICRRLICILITYIQPETVNLAQRHIYGEFVDKFSQKSPTLYGNGRFVSIYQGYVSLQDTNLHLPRPYCRGKPGHTVNCQFSVGGMIFSG